MVPTLRYEADFAAQEQGACFERPQPPRNGDYKLSKGDLPCCHFSHRGPLLWGVSQCFAMVQVGATTRDRRGGARVRFVGMIARPDPTSARTRGGGGNGSLAPGGARRPTGGAGDLRAARVARRVVARRVNAPPFSLLRPSRRLARRTTTRDEERTRNTTTHVRRHD